MAWCALLALGLGLPSCAALRRGALTTARATEPGMPCAEAMTVARGAVTRMGYTIERVEPAAPESPGRVVGRRTSGWTAAAPEPGTEYMVLVRVSCSDQGSVFEAATDESVERRLGFRQQFPREIEEIARRRTRPSPPRAGAPAKQGLVISVTLLRGGEARQEFGADLPAAGVTPVRVTLENRSSRTYGFSPDKVQLVTQGGERVRALPAADLAGRLDPAVAAGARGRLVAEGDVGPGGTVSGFLYFPVSAYRRANVVVIDRGADEAEGFRIDF